AAPTALLSSAHCRNGSKAPPPMAGPSLQGPCAHVRLVPYETTHGSDRLIFALLLIAAHHSFMNLSPADSPMRTLYVGSFVVLLALGVRATFGLFMTAMGVD